MEIVILTIVVISILAIEYFRNLHKEKPSEEPLENMEAEVKQDAEKLEVNGDFNLTQKEEPKKKSNKRKPKQKL